MRLALHPPRVRGELQAVTPRPFTLLFDSECPFCKLEVEWLQRRDRNGLLRAIDIAAPFLAPLLLDGTNPPRVVPHDSP